MEGKFQLDPRDADHADFPIRKPLDPQDQLAIFIRKSNQDPVAFNRVFVVAYSRGKNAVELVYAVSHIPFKGVTLIGAGYQRPVPRWQARSTTGDRRPDRDRVAGFQSVTGALVLIQINAVQEHKVYRVLGNTEAVYHRCGRRPLGNVDLDQIPLTCGGQIGPERRK